MEIITDIARVFERFRNIPYLGEGVTQREHALQAAREAEKARASDELITAALLHDIGHLIHSVPLEDESYVGYWTKNDGHETAGANWLARAFPETVYEPVRWHVRAKRYLCATEPGYYDQLTAGAQHSLELQGGPLTPQECREFEKHQWCQESIAVRRWDDNAKQVGRTTPPMDHYLDIARRCVKAAANGV
jgi:phosphonate degradation associated HDIG domain protein